MNDRFWPGFFGGLCAGTMLAVIILSYTFKPQPVPVETFHVLTTDEIVAAISECASRTEKLEPHWDRNAYGDILQYQCQPPAEEMPDNLHKG
jgi:hypothetical protein